ncbi:MAG: hypothetical protein M3081_11315 [Gemmatimonadota bacterium]|nr:hypothetical protein [Gemmatimonadota bacterium]
MRPLGIVGVILIIAGVVVLALRGVSYTKERHSVQVGPIGLSAEEKGFVPPVVGVIAIGVGVAMLIGSRRRA